MKRIVRVFIDSNDAFFTLGVQYLVLQYFTAKKIPVTFLLHPLDHTLIDIIVLAKDNGENSFLRHFLPETHCREKTIMVLSSNEHADHRAQARGVIYRHQKARKLLSLIDSIWRTIQHRRIVTLMPPTQVALDTLTPRQREVLYYTTKGLPQVHIGRLMKISLKTVSTHKRQAMMRLRVQNTATLHQWFCSQ